MKVRNSHSLYLYDHSLIFWGDTLQTMDYMYIVMAYDFFTFDFVIVLTRLRSTCTGLQ